MLESMPKILSEQIHEQTSPEDNPLASLLVKLAIKHASLKSPLGANLAAVFDLVVASKYFTLVLPENWLWCEWSKMDFYPIQNVCPYCVLDERYVYHPGNKPGSGQIGPATAESLREILACYFHQTKRPNLLVYSGKEPIDLAIIDSKTKNIFIAEVKASPLFTPPLAIPHSRESMQTSESAPLRHSRGIARNLQAAEVSIFVPKSKGNFIKLALPTGSFSSGNPPTTAMVKAIEKSPEFVINFFGIWLEMWASYVKKPNDNPLYWFVGACGLPNSPGEGWPKTSDGKPKGSISDSKTSVGMDRTDDIKKATFQALKLGVENRKKDYGDWELKIGLASNLHAARHYSSYLSPYQDLVWGWGKEGKAPSDLYNLFDGIISFSWSHTRDKWLRDLIDWERSKK